MSEIPQELLSNLRATLDKMPGFAWYASATGGLTFVNIRSAEYHQIPADHPIRLGTIVDAAWDSHLVFVHPEDHENTRRVWANCLKTGRGGEVEFRTQGADGIYRWFLSRAEPLRAEDGTILLWVGLNLEIDDRKRAESELRQMLDFAPQLVCVHGASGEQIHINRIALAYFGMTLEEWQKSRLADKVHPDDAERVVRAEAVADREYELELRLRRHDGVYRWFLSRFNPVRDDRGQIVRWYHASTDIEERKRVEERLQQENITLRKDIDQTSMFEEIIGTAAALQPVRARVAKVARSQSTVMITGETGTGKELVARSIHRRSARGDRTFIGLNCAAVPRELIASELFGHEKGAFTGATQRRLGRFELAHGGTLFLDEVGELSMETQVALLRVLQEREVERIGGTSPIRVDVRVIAATNRDLKAAVDAGTFRADLFYRLNVFPIVVPPLRERADDIPLLVEYFVGRYARQAGKSIRRIDKQTLGHLQAYPWPGNVRELQNVIERSVIVCETDEFTVDESWLSVAVPTVGLSSNAFVAHERAVIEAALRATGGRVSGPAGAADRLGIPRSTLESKIRSLGINKNRFRP
jgi:PAS domain S-box-containing protein